MRQAEVPDIEVREVAREVLEVCEVLDLQDPQEQADLPVAVGAAEEEIKSKKQFYSKF